MKPCRECGADLVVGVNMTEQRVSQYNWICRPCKSAQNDPIKRAGTKRNDPQRNRERGSEWSKNNRGRRAASKAKRMARLKNQTPEMNAGEWAEIDAMYLYNQIMPGKWHVDHIDPIDNGGLHHPENLQILSEHDNCSKGHRV